ncbi:MAG: hypothetical protein AB1344_02980 [Pseudomonadota bacterium]
MAALLEISRSLCRAIADDEHPLEDLEVLLLERDARIRDLLSQPLESSLRAVIQDWIREIQALDADALQHLQVRRQRIGASFSEMRHGMRMMSRYEDTHSLGED